jgi:hypothetical protein
MTLAMYRQYTTPAFVGEFVYLSTAFQTNAHQLLAHTVDGISIINIWWVVGSSVAHLGLN